jgi:steroid delta-isomerase-like uncharacterized protein
VSGADNKAIVRRLHDEVWTQGRMAVADELIASNFVGHIPGSPPYRGPAGFKALVTELRVGFPDLVLTVDDQFGEGDKVVTEYSVRGRQRGKLWGIPATGRSINLAGVVIAQLSDGKIVEEWREWDRRKILEQLGMLPATG